jgi:translocation and assembly module TamB
MKSGVPLKRRRRARDYGQLLALLACLLFALIGLVPLSLAAVVEAPPVTQWASHKVSEWLADEVGVDATFRVDVSVLPLELAVEDLVVASRDGGAPALQVERAMLRPRLFALLGGRFQVSQIVVDNPRARLVLSQGKLVNLTWRLPQLNSAKPAPTPTERPPFETLSVNGARARIELDGVDVDAGSIDVDVFGSRGPAFEVALRAAGSTVYRERNVTRKVRPKHRGDPPSALFLRAIDEDVLCRLDVRARIDREQVLVRRLSLVGFLDEDFDPGTRARCQLEEAENSPSQVALRVSRARVGLTPGQRPAFAGELSVRAPLSVVGRFAPKAPVLTGWAEFSGEIRLDSRARLPTVHGSLRGEGIRLDRYRLAKTLAAEVELANERVSVSRAEVGLADGLVRLKNVSVAPLEKGVPFKVEESIATGVDFPALMRDLGVAPHTIVAWKLQTVKTTEVGGTLVPLHLDGKLSGDTRDFTVFDRGFDDPVRKAMIGVRAATLRGRFGVRPDSLEFYDTRASFGKSQLDARLVAIGFSNTIELDIGESKLDLSDVTPVAGIPWAGVSTIVARMKGPSWDPQLEGTLAIKDFVFGGFPLGDIESSKVRFRPLAVDFESIRGRKNKSEFVGRTARLDFNRKGAIIVDAQVESQRFELRDFFSMFRFDEDPRFAGLAGQGAVATAIHYELNGPEDRCKGGYLRVQGRTDIARADLYEELYDGGKLDFDFVWADRLASYRGVTLDVPSFTLTKGSGTVLGSLRMTPGAKLTGHVVATAVPLASIQTLGSLGTMVDGRADAVAEIGGSIDALEMDSHVTLSPLRIGTRTLPGSSLDVRLEPSPLRKRPVGVSRCGQPLSAAFDPGEYARDEADGTYVTSGSLFGGQIDLVNLATTRQRKKRVSGRVIFRELDLGKLGQLSPLLALAEPKPEGKLTGVLDVDELRFDEPGRARARFSMGGLALAWNGVNLAIERSAEPIRAENGVLNVPELALRVGTDGGPEAVFDVRARVKDLMGANEVDATLDLRPVALASLAGPTLGVERAAGGLDGQLRLSGPAARLRYTGGFQLRGGELMLPGLPAPITDAELDLVLDGSELRVERGTARVGDGSLDLTGSAELRGFELGNVRGRVVARSLGLPLTEGVRATVDADLVASYAPSKTAEGRASLPRVTGAVMLQSFEYTRPITLAADLGSITQRGRRTSFESYDPEDDSLEFDVTLRAQRALEIHNNLIDASLDLPQRGLELAGTNQRFGVRGAVNVRRGGRIRLRRNEFEISRGEVRFEDLTRIAPQVDVEATTEYRRVASQGGAARQQDGGTTSASANASATAGGRWLITMRAHGDAEKLQVDLTSQPSLAQDDIFLLLTIGLTRAELEQAQAASVGGSVALEALGTLTGADRAVREVVPVIDEFRFGSAYSSRTGRTEPTVTIGKRLAERIRANVTTGLSESREVKSNVVVQLRPRLSVEGSYGNVNDITRSSVGNLGADVRWRLEFE